MSFLGHILLPMLILPKTNVDACFSSQLTAISYIFSDAPIRTCLTDPSPLFATVAIPNDHQLPLTMHAFETLQRDHIEHVRETMSGARWDMR